MKSPISGCKSPRIVKSSQYNKRFKAKNVLKLENDAKDSKGNANYWLAATRTSKNQGFMVDLKCEALISAIVLKNTHNAKHKDRATKKFRVLGLKKLGGAWVSNAHFI